MVPFRVVNPFVQMVDRHSTATVSIRHTHILKFGIPINPGPGVPYRYFISIATRNGEWAPFVDGSRGENWIYGMHVLF